MKWLSVKRDGDHGTPLLAFELVFESVFESVFKFADSDLQHLQRAAFLWWRERVVQFGEIDRSQI